MKADHASVTALLLFTLTSCAGPAIERLDTGQATEEVNPYLPLSVGNWWTYRVTDSKGNTISKTQTVLERQKVGGTGPAKDVDAFFVRSDKSDEDFDDKTESWQGTVRTAEGLATVRYRELAYRASDGTFRKEEYWHPYKLRVDDYHTTADGPWENHYDKSIIPADATEPPEYDVAWYDALSVQHDASSITVPIGTFAAKLLHRRAADPSNPDKLYWFVAGIGKVQETGKQTEQLVDCVVGGRTCAELASGGD